MAPEELLEQIVERGSRLQLRRIAGVFLVHRLRRRDVDDGIAHGIREVGEGVRPPGEGRGDPWNGPGTSGGAQKERAKEAEGGARRPSPRHRARPKPCRAENNRKVTHENNLLEAPAKARSGRGRRNWAAGD